jgi:histidinol-phosphate phosphatase family protein
MVAQEEVDRFVRGYREQPQTDEELGYSGAVAIESLSRVQWNIPTERSVGRSPKRRAVFLDLQGTLGGEGLGDIRDFTIYPCATSAIGLINSTGLLAIVVTNQSRIAKGHFTLSYFWDRMTRLRGELAEARAKLDDVYCCPHGNAGSCACCKPRPGMLVQAARDHDLDLRECYVVGDTGAADMAMARTAGCQAVLVRTGLGEGSLTDYRHLWAELEPDFVADDVLEAAEWIARREAGGSGR